MKEKDEARIISINSESFSIYKKDRQVKIILKDIDEIGENTYTEEIWAIISNKTQEYLTVEQMISDYKSRETLISNIVNITIKNNISGVVIDASKFNNYNNIMKFINELAPRLYEIGIITAVRNLPEEMEEELVKTVDYIIK